MGTSEILYTAQRGLFAQQTAIQIAGQNIANVNTPGYSRQRPTFDPNQTSFAGGSFNSGVEVDEIARVYDKFIVAQINTATADLHSRQEQADHLGQIEALFNDLALGDAGLSSAIEKLFQGFQSVADDAQSMPERISLRQQANSMAAIFQRLQGELKDLRQKLNDSLKDELTKANRLATEVADLNGKILAEEANPKNNANVLRDERDVLLRELAELLGTRSFETPDGQVTILVPGDRPLVESVRTQTLITSINPDDSEQLFVNLRDSQGNLTNITTNISGGKLHGLIQARDTAVPGFLSQLDRLAAQVTGSVNQLHRTGFGLNGTTGNPFFVARQITGQALNANQGGATLTSSTVFDPTQLTFDDYRINFTGAATFDIVNSTTGATVAAAQAYVSGAAIRFNGIQVVITNGAGAPQNGDVFLFNTTKNAAANIAVDTNIVNEAKNIAAAQTPVAGDNANALALADLRTSKLINGNTVGEFYNLLVADIGVQSQQNAALLDRQQIVVTEMENRRDSISGVSLDEEQVDLIRFQQAFAASANLIRIANEMTQTVLGLLQ